MKYLIAALSVGVLSAAACRDAPTAQVPASAVFGSDAAGDRFFETPPPPFGHQLGVMTYNLFLGANLAPIMTATTFPGVVQAATIAWGQAQATDFRIRAGAIANLIAEKHPLLVGLEEVARWETASASAPTSFTTRYDFLTLLLDSLTARGTPYRVAVVDANFTAVLPVALDLSLLGRYSQSNAIIVRDDLEDVKFLVSNPVAVTFQHQMPATIAGQPLNIGRGYASIDVWLREKWVRFVATQLEAYHIPSRMAQAQELVDSMAQSPYDVILVGDLNSWRTFAGDSWQIFTAAGLVDVWTETMPGVVDNTASFGDDLNWPLDSLNHTVDYVMRTDRGALKGVLGQGEVVGDDPGDKTPNGWWPSDHAGVFATVKIVRN